MNICFIILELDSLFNEARNLLSKSEEKTDQLLVLEPNYVLQMITLGNSV